MSGPNVQLDDDGSVLLDAQGLLRMAGPNDPRCCCSVNRCGSSSGAYATSPGVGVCGPVANPPSCYLASWTGVGVGRDCYRWGESGGTTSSPTDYSVIQPQVMRDGSSLMWFNGATATSANWVSRNPATTDPGYIRTMGAVTGFKSSFLRDTGGACVTPQDPYIGLTGSIGRGLLASDPTAGYYSFTIIGPGSLGGHRSLVVFSGVKRICCCTLPSFTIRNALTAGMVGQIFQNYNDAGGRLTLNPPVPPAQDFAGDPSPVIIGYGGTVTISIQPGGPRGCS